MTELAFLDNAIVQDGVIRNHLLHGYVSVDLELFWKTVERDIPELKAQIVPLFQAAG